jgi:hypothetical protein
MQCTFCGTENRPEYKFCGTCGVRLERRQVERRARAAGVSLKCSGCGYLNEPGMKFCGMCGTRIERRAQERRGAENEPRAAAIANAQLPSPDVAARVKTEVAATLDRAEEPPVALPRRSEPAIFRDEPGSLRDEPRSLNDEPRNGAHISGPSFLGLNSQPEGNGEYLLEDEPSRGGLRKLVLLVILAAILGLVFVQWRSSFKANPKPAPTTEPASSPQNTPQSGNQPQGAAAKDQTQQDAAKATGAGENAEDASPSGPSTESKNQKNAGAAASSTVTPAAAAETSAGMDAEKKDDAKEAAKPGADSKPEDARIPDYKPSAALLRAQQYIRGHGVKQNCEQGLLYLHAATEKNDPGAAIQMAALYSSGLCVKQDRVMAYRWFNSAHELQPANMWIQKNMDQLWAQMTSQERRLAGY